MKKDKLYDITNMWNLKKNDTNEFIYKTDSQTQKTKLLVTKGERLWQGWGGRINQEAGINIYTLYYTAQGTLLNIL